MARETESNLSGLAGSGMNGVTLALVPGAFTAYINEDTKNEGWARRAYLLPCAFLLDIAKTTSFAYVALEMGRGFLNSL